MKREYIEIVTEGANLPFKVYPLESNFLEWHFTLQGPSDSSYSDGLYHGKILFPGEYPFSPPTVLFHTPSGRFQINTKICLTVTGFHPEHWQPAWGCRTILIAIRDYFTVEDRAQIGYLGLGETERRQLALSSIDFQCKTCGYNMEMENRKRLDEENIHSDDTSDEMSNSKKESEQSEEKLENENNQTSSIPLIVSENPELKWLVMALIVAIVAFIYAFITVK